MITLPSKPELKNGNLISYYILKIKIHPKMLQNLPTVYMIYSRS